MSKQVEKTCPHCHGYGELYVAAYDRYYECFYCDGTGMVLETVEDEAKEEVQK